MINVEIHFYLKDGTERVEHVCLTEEGFFEIQRSSEDEKKRLECSIVGLDEKIVSKIEMVS